MSANGSNVSHTCLYDAAAQPASVSSGDENSRVREERLKRQLAIAERLTRRYREALHELAQ